MTKAERIFRATYAACRQSAKTWGLKYNPDGRPIGFNSIFTEDDESYCTRTLNDIQKHINSERSHLRMCEKLGTMTGDKLEARKYALEMVQVTVDNSRKILAEIC